VAFGFGVQKALISLKHGKIGPQLLLRTNRKSCTRSELSIGTKINDLDGSLPYALCFKTHVSFGAHRENFNENRYTLSAIQQYRGLRSMPIINTLHRRNINNAKIMHGEL